jgi:hypothetical protein
MKKRLLVRQIIDFKGFGIIDRCISGSYSYSASCRHDNPSVAYSSLPH